ncbi:hypothetical protein CK220_26820 [Mesorhizobium sp. WSM3860]|nr:hypothetical protein CK220_26820 [Mesorhizobium sp. WSM3860]
MRPSFTIDYSLFPIPYSLFPIPYSLFPIPYSLFPIHHSPLPNAPRNRSASSPARRALPASGARRDPAGR